MRLDRLDRNRVKDLLYVLYSTYNFKTRYLYLSDVFFFLHEDAIVDLSRGWGSQ